MIDFSAFTDEVTKIAESKSKVLSMLARHPKKALVGAALGGAGAYHGGKQAIQDWQLGRSIRKQSRRR